MWCHIIWERVHSEQKQNRQIELNVPCMTLCLVAKWAILDHSSAAQFSIHFRLTPAQFSTKNDQTRWLIISLGANRLAGNIETMIGRRPPLYFIICWKFITPLLLLVSNLEPYVTAALPGVLYTQSFTLTEPLNNEMSHWFLTIF